MSRRVPLGDLRTQLWHLRHGGVAQWRTHRRRASLPAGPAASAVVTDPAAAGSHQPPAREGNRVTFAAQEWPEREPVRADITAAVVLDDFSLRAFHYEWNQVELSRENWREELAVQPVDLLLVESAWHGNHDQWQYQFTGTSGVKEPVRELVAHCRERGIPTVFWNKEDPPHYDDFLECARLFDVVFTTDVNKIPDYHRDLGHDRVGVLPFAAQPAVHSPARPKSGFHTRDVAFGGMYFAHKFPERREQMDLLLGGAHDISPKLGTGLEIFSRYLGHDERYQFPAPLDGHVVGSLDYEQMLTAYRAYKVFLNVNSVVDSPSMCARRIFEITACGTTVVSTPSEAVRRYFTQDQLSVVADRRHAADVIRALVRSPELADRMVHRAQREIWAKHTYTHRVETVLERAAPHLARARTRPTVTVLLCTNRPHRVPSALRGIAAQRNVQLDVVLVAHGFDPAAPEVDDAVRASGLRVTTVTADASLTLGECLNLAVAHATGDVLSKMDDDDHYAPRYLADLLDALSYANADVVGKQAHYMHVESQDATLLRFPWREHRYTDFVMGPTITGYRHVFHQIPFQRRSTGEDTSFLAAVRHAGYTIYSADRFNFVQFRGAHGHTWQVSDAAALAAGDVVLFGDNRGHVTV
ncbi:glycosyltransferase family protein [Kocuria tytonis]|uniref:Glycosyltransferase n=1 Tax=Kocuria tytonis TaxID=2054280 RepID=A0A495AAJ9_9MICC|nr:glycosyltransferase [Kocuria tytonis]RKQ36424.1 glycosyltransferase [Kocuria tytonis]